MSHAVFHGKNSRCTVGNSRYHLLSVRRLLSSANLNRRVRIVINRKQLSTVLGTSPSNRHTFVRRTTNVLGRHGHGRHTLHGLTGARAGLDQLSSLLKRVRHRLIPLKHRTHVSQHTSTVRVSMHSTRTHLCTRSTRHSVDHHSAMHRRLNSIHGRLTITRHRLTRTGMHVRRIRTLDSRSDPTVTGTGRC